MVKKWRPKYFWYGPSTHAYICNNKDKPKNYYNIFQYWGYVQIEMGVLVVAASMGLSFFHIWHKKGLRGIYALFSQKVMAKLN